MIRIVSLNVNRMLRLIPALAICGIVLCPSMVKAAPRSVADAQADGVEWLIMIYSDADDNVLEEDLLIDLQEAELVGSTPQVTIVAQTDRYEGSFAGMGDWTGAKRFLITQDDDLASFGSTELEDLGEVNMADGETLLDFIEWAVTTYPARKRMLILSDHGAGWPGGWSDPAPGGPGADNVPLLEAFGDNLWLMELDRTLEQARFDLGLDYFDVVGFDACLMSQIEVYTALAPHALYAVGSEETEPGLGWAYAGFLSRLVEDPEMGGDELVQAIVDSYIDEDIRLDDPTYVGGLTRAQAAAAINPDATLTAIDLAHIPPLGVALDNFVDALVTMDQNSVAEARTYAQAYESVFGDELPSPYIDLGHFVQLIQTSTDDPIVQSVAEELENVRQDAVIAEKHGEARPGSTGIAIYFPVRELYVYLDNFGYADIATRFVESTQWDEYLTFHLGDKDGEFFARPAQPLFAGLQQLLPDSDPENLQLLADEIGVMLDQGLSANEIEEALVSDYEVPEDIVLAIVDAGLLGAAEDMNALPVNNVQRKPLQIAPITLSAEVAYPDAAVSVDTEISGDRVGYVYSFIGRFLPEDDVLIIEDQDFLFAEQDTTVGGVTYPQWPAGTFGVGYDWQPVVYAVSDGNTSIRALFAPETYGDSPMYTVDGDYSFANGSPSRYARIFFREGELAYVYGFTGSGNDGVGAPREIRPQAGDQFTVYSQGFNLAEDAADEFYSAPSGTLTFGDEIFFIDETPAPSGNYVVGVIAEDLDGNEVEAYADLFVVGEDEVTEEGFVPLVAEDLGFALLYPETWWPVDAGEGTGRRVLTNVDDTAQITISTLAYPEAPDSAEASRNAFDDILAEFAASVDIENLTLAGDPVDYMMGWYDAQLLDFTFDAGDVAYSGEIVVSEPVGGVTYVVDLVAPSDEFEVLLSDLDALLYSFTVLEASSDSDQSGASQPEFSDIFFLDEYDDPASGLYDDVSASDWGMGYYDLDAELYVYEMNPASGAIFDYYPDLILANSFMLQASTQTAGALDTAYGLIFQVQDDGHFYVVRLSGDGYLLIEKADGEDLVTLVDWTAADTFDGEEGAVNTLAVVGADNAYGVYVNGIQVAEFADESYVAGSAGYMVENFDRATPAVFGFDDLVLGVPPE